MTKIQWTDETWNPVVGCSKVHTGCTNCYAEVMASRPLPAFVDRHNLTVTDGRWNGRIIEQPERLLLPLKWRKPRRIFVTSMSDIGHPELSDEALARVYGVMLLAGHHTFQNLTKRPAEIERFKREWSPVRCLDAVMMAMIATMGRAVAWGYILPDKIKLGASTWSDIPHIHEYVSVSDQATADEFIPQLLRVPAAVRGVSLEPMVGAVDLTCLQHQREFELNALTGDHGVIRPLQGKGPHIDHVIVGGESGRNARPCDIAWVRGVVKQCQDARTPVFVKQIGSNAGFTNYEWDTVSWVALEYNDPKGGNPSEWPADLRVRMHVGEGW